MSRPRAVLSIPQLRIHPESILSHEGADWAIATTDDDWRLVIRSTSTDLLSRFDGEIGEQEGRPVLVGPTTSRNAAQLRAHLPWLVPKPLGQCMSFGFGDRLGLAARGHIQALRKAGGSIQPVFAQQSARELTRTQRTAQEVLDAATWGAFEQGWTGSQGADADHLKTTADIDTYLAAGFSMFTIDPGDYVGRISPETSLAALRLEFDGLPWSRLEDTPGDVLRRYARRPIEVEDLVFTPDADTIIKAAIKYGRAVVHVAEMCRHLVAAAGSRPVELEVSVDETDDPTTPIEHIYVASELRRLGISWASLAPRLAGRFEKGVDYIGDLRAFEADWRVHASIARELGPYKLSLHSGSDKFSIYGTVAEQSRGIVHVKTAGTSWLEAVRTLAAVDVPLFREIYSIAHANYEKDRASYHVSARIDAAPALSSLRDEALAGLLDDFHARQILHVTFGTILNARRAAGGERLADSILAELKSHSDAYAANLESHFLRHLRPFAG